MSMYTSLNVLNYTCWCVMFFLSKLYITKKKKYTTENCRVAGSRHMGRHGKPCCSVNPDSLFQNSKTCPKRHLKLDKTKVLMENSSLMKVESFSEFSHWSIL